MSSRAVADWLFDRYVRRLVGQHFTAVHVAADVAGTASVRPLQSRRPPSDASTMLVANHTNWWDGFLAWLVSRELGLRFHILMEAGNLDRYWMFKRIGALPMHRDNRRAAYRDLGEAGKLFAADGNHLWIFPQGARRPAEEPVAGTEHGAAHLAVAHRCAIVPVAFRYRFLGEQLPEAFIQLGKPFQAASAERRLVARDIEHRMQLTIDALDRQLQAEQVADFALLLQGRLSINKRLDRVRHAAGTIDGPFDPRNG
jgi:1-acyl-sn-glycerol-3-phosphate acyltransferase